MDYISLYKHFFTSKDNGKEVYESRFNSPSTIRFKITNKDYPFFVIINNEILRLSEQIYSLNSQIIKMVYADNRIPGIVVHWIIHHILIEEIRMTNEIEGVSSTRKEIKELLETTPPKHYKRLFGLVSKYSQLINNVSIDINDPIDIRKLYDSSMLKDIEKENPENIPDGEVFRKEAVEVDSGGKAIHTGINPESHIIQTMAEALNILNDEKLSLLVRVAVFHYLFGFIHPFYDGNGRMSRFISSAYLKKELDNLCALQLSVSCKMNQKQYYNSFQITNDIRNKGDLTYFVISFLEIILSGLIALKESIEEKISHYFYYRKIIFGLKSINPKHNALLDVLLQCTLFDTDNLTVEQLVQITDHSKATIKKWLSNAEIQPFLVIDRSKRQYRYALNLEAIDHFIEESTPDQN